MKKSFLFIFGMMLSASVGMLLNSYAGAFSDDEGLLEALFEEADISARGSSDLAELQSLASDTKVPFNNLYLYMLKNTTEGPQEAALNSLSERFLGQIGKVKYTKAELEAIVIEGNVTPLVERLEEQARATDSATLAEQEAAQKQADADMAAFLKNNDFSDTTKAYLEWKYKTTIQPQISDPKLLSAAATSEGIVNEYIYLTGLYENELEFQRENRKLGTVSLAAELFYNKDLSDSASIDLLYDLDLVHYLLFGESISYPDRSGETDVSLSSETAAVFDLPQASVEESSDVYLASTAPLSPYVCFEDEDLLESLEVYSEDPPERGDAFETGSEVVYKTVEPGEEASETEAGMARLDGFITQLEVKKGNWTRSLPCNDVFCVTVSVVDANDDSTVDGYEPTENCIACHTAYISQRMTETTSKSLVPSKITMNWFEDATCKEAGNLVNLDLNVYAIKKPIVLDPGDDIDETAQKDIDEFKTRLFGLTGIPFETDKSSLLGKTLADLECESILNIHDLSGSNLPTSSVLERCQEAEEALLAQTDDAYEEFIFDPYSQGTSDLYQQVSAELYTMLIQFRNFQEGLKATYETEDAPLSSLASKGYCE